MTVSQNYAGRAVDICVLDTSNKDGVELINVGFLGSGSAVSGPYKIVQKFAKFLLTDLGSVPAEPNYGTDFIRRLLGGQIQTISELRIRFFQELGEIKTYIANSVENPPADETLVSVQLEDFSNVSQDDVVMKLRFTFLDQSTILAPVRISTV